MKPEMAVADAREKNDDENVEPPTPEDDEDSGEDEHLYDDWDDLATDPEEVSKLGRTLEGLLPDVVKRGVGGLVSEDGLRALVKERELPREAVGFILGQADATKREVLRIVSREVRLFLENVDLGGELTKILTSVSFEIRTEVRFIPNDASSALKPNVKNRVDMHGQDGESKTLADDEQESEDDEQSESDREGREDGEPDPEADGGERRRRRWSLRRRRRQPDSEESDDDGGEDGGEDEG